MARIIAQRLDPFPDQDSRKGDHRYRLDWTALIRYFGGQDNISRLCDLYGVPRVSEYSPESYRKRVPMNTSNLAVLLELAERMRRPLDLYQFVIERR